MEDTLGKRIMQHRKRLGLTQDALAEKLGITPQAISKWENNLSCPDISMLPRLADLFGITTDELLGHPVSEAVYEAEVVENEEEMERTGMHSEDDNRHSWSFHWDVSGSSAALALLTSGVLLLVCRILEWDVSFWSILWPSWLLFYGVNGLLQHFSTFRLSCVLLGGYFLSSNLHIWSLDNTHGLFFPVCVILFGASLFFDHLGKPIFRRKSKKRKQQGDYSQDDNSFHCDLSFGELTYAVNTVCLEEGSANVSFGNLTLDLSDVDAVSKTCQLELDCAFGELNLLVPKTFLVQYENDTFCGAIKVSGKPNAHPDGIIQLENSVSFGKLNIIYQ